MVYFLHYFIKKFSFNAILTSFPICFRGYENKKFLLFVSGRTDKWRSIIRRNYPQYFI